MGTLSITNQLTCEEWSIDKVGTVRPTTKWPEPNYVLVGPDYLDQLNERILALLDTSHDEKFEYNTDKYKCG